MSKSFSVSIKEKALSKCRYCGPSGKLSLKCLPDEIKDGEPKPDFTSQGNWWVECFGCEQRSAEARHAVGACQAWNALQAASEELPVDMLSMTFAVQYNPNCAARFLVRLVGSGGVLDFRPYGVSKDAIGHGKTLPEACASALKRKGEIK